MLVHSIPDWDDAYAVTANIPDRDSFPHRWAEDAKKFRNRANCTLDVKYGEGKRQIYDLFHPNGVSRGLFVFVHGGYWKRFDKSSWSQFSAGMLAKSYTVCIPSYPLCPDVDIGEIVASVAKAVEHAAETTSGPIYLAGHSAGGHIVSYLATTVSGIGSQVAGRIVSITSISGVHDLRPILNTQMNETLAITPKSAAQLSPALLKPRDGTVFNAWVGAGEVAEFVRQNRMLADIWIGLGASTSCYEEPGRNHFTVLDGLLDSSSSIVNRIAGLG